MQKSKYVSLFDHYKERKRNKKRKQQQKKNTKQNKIFNYST